MEAKPAEIRIQLSLFGDRIELSTYNEIARQIQTVLEEEERSLTGKPPHTSWILDTSAVIPVAASPNGTSEEDLRRIVRETRNEFARALGMAQDADSQSSPKSRAAVHRILAQLGDEVHSIVVTGDDVDEVAIERTSIAGESPVGLAAASDGSEFVPGRHYEDIGTIEGVIDLISVRGRTPRFSIRERWTGRHINAMFDDTMLETVTSALGRQVEVTGLIRFRAPNDPVSIQDVSRILWHADEASDILTFEGALPDLVSGMDEGDYIRELRSGEIGE